MNRGRSNDSLYENGDEDVVFSGSGSGSNSSSPADFTSDDETNASKLRSHLNSAPKIPLSMHTTNNQGSHSFRHLMRHHYNHHHHLLAQRAAKQIASSDANQRLGFIDSGEPDQFGSQSIFTHSQASSSKASLRLPDIVPSPNSISLTEPQIQYSTLSHEHDSEGGTPLSLRSRELKNPWRVGRADPNEPLVSKELNALLTDLDRADDSLFPLLDAPQPTNSSVAGPASRTATVRMCARFVECRNLIDAIELVEDNREFIEGLTRIVTLEAPAFRNYDISNYQIDYSVKESFNPNFWLDREPVVTTADGNCQYHAVSLSLTGSEAYTPEVRLATVVAVIDKREYFDAMLKLIDRGTVLDLIHTIARNYSWGDETTLKAIAVAINRRIFLYTCNTGKKDYEMVKLSTRDELLDAFEQKKYRGGTGIHTYADPAIQCSPNNYIMMFHKSEHFIAVLPTTQQPTMFEPYNPIVPLFV